MPDLATPAERAEYRTTPDYATTVEYLERLAGESRGRMRVENFGSTGEGRDLKIAIASRGGVFDPDAAHAEGRAVVLVQNCIHAGEPDGKDACLALLRDALLDPAIGALLGRVVLVVIPVYNVDGHERRSKYHRINQNGPEQQGWRANATNLNLNRDYLKADAPETRAFLRLVGRWRPDFFVDDHVTDGADFQYDVTFAVDTTPDVFPATAQWLGSTVVPELVRAVDGAGHLAFPAPIFLRDDSDPARGLAFHENPPRFSTGYMILRNRPGLLVEMHMLKDYRTRVTGNYALLRGLLGVLHRDAGRLRECNRAADAAARDLGLQPFPRPPFPLVLGPTGASEPVRFRGREYRRYPSELSGATAIRYGPTATDATLPSEPGSRVVVAVVPPAGYLIPPSWTGVIDVLDAHGVESRRTTAPWSGPVEQYRCSGMRWPSAPFEGRHPILGVGNVEPGFGTFGRCVRSTEHREFRAGSVVVPLDQPLAKVAIHWLEPEAPDSALRWGFFSSIFEQKESGESYVLERLGAEMAEREPKLRAEFTERLRSDPALASDPAARLGFFYERSPWYSAQRVGEYPVVRLMSLDGIPTVPRPPTRAPGGTSEAGLTATG
jgi:hypothetical protein